MKNHYCDALGMEVPSVEKAAQSRDACSYSLLIAVLLERGAPVTLEQAAQRIAAAGVGNAESVLASLKRSRPARPPLYRNGDLYELDPHDDEASLWAFRLGLLPPKAQPLPVVGVKTEQAPLPGPDKSLTLDELAEVWRRYIPAGFSLQRVTVCVLDAHQRPMKPEDIAAYLAERSGWHARSLKADHQWNNAAPVRIRDDGMWELRVDHIAVTSARRAVRTHIERDRHSPRREPDRAAVLAQHQLREKEAEAHADQLEGMSRVLIHAFVTDRPEAIVLIDVNRRQIETFLGEHLGRAVERLKNYDVIAGFDVRNTLQMLNFDPGSRLLHELGPYHKSRKINRQGRTLKITTEMLIRGTCGISHPLGDKATLLAYLQEGQETKFRRRLEADAKSLFALYQYGRLHHTVRLRWGFLDDQLPAAWAHGDEKNLYDLKKCACEKNVLLELVLGSAPGWEDPWSRVRPACVRKDQTGWRYDLFDLEGHYIHEPDVQCARLMEPKHGN